MCYDVIACLANLSYVFTLWEICIAMHVCHEWYAIITIYFCSEM